MPQILAGGPLTRRSFVLAVGSIAVVGCNFLRSRQDPAQIPAAISTVITPAVAESSPQIASVPVTFRDVSRAAGVSWTFNNGSPNNDTTREPFIVQTGGGVALWDFNNDGLLDIFAVQGGPLPYAPAGGVAFSTQNVLYRNNGNGTFTDVTREAGLLGPTGYGQGVSVADYNNDGHLDLYITAIGGNHLYRNNGDGTFTDVTESAGVADKFIPGLHGHMCWPTSSAWGDYDNDGFLDLFVCHYCQWSPEIDRDDTIGQFPAPMQFPPSHCRLYHNNGDGTFTDVTDRANLQGLWGKSLSAVWIDYDSDGWPDLFVTNDTMPNFLLHNNRDGTFTNRAVEAGAAYDRMGHATASMGIGVSDYLHEGREDLFVVNYSGESKTVLHNMGGVFQDAAQSSGITDANLHFLGFGLECFDYDLDGWPDIIIGNGHVSPMVAKAAIDGETFAQSQLLLHNQGDGKFVQDNRSLGDLVVPRVTRGLAVGDFDNDGDVDVVMVSQQGPLSLYRNDGGNRNNWITLRLEGVRSNRDAVGAKVTIVTAAGRQTQWVRSGSSYCSHSDMRLTFGLKGEHHVLAIEVRWPSAKRQRFKSLSANRFYWLREGAALVDDPRIPKLPSKS